MAQVPNKNIDNASGQVVRLDIQNTTKAGPRNDAGTILPCEFLADDTTNKLLIRKSSGGDQANPNPTSGTAADFFPVGNLDEDNLGLLPKAGGTMTGQLLGDDGSGASSPAYAFDGDTNTGMFRNSANTLGFASAGVERAIIDANGLTIRSQGDIRLGDSNSSHFVAIQAPSSVSSNVTFTLPGADGTNGQMLQTNGSGALSFTTVAGVPTGAVFCMAVATVPSGYLECNGAAVSRTTYAVLFAVIGTQYGVGNGSSTFNLPDLRGEFVRGFDNGRGIDSGRSISATPQSDQNKQHNHSANGVVGDHVHNYAFAQGSNGGVGNNFGGSGINNVSQSGGRLAELEQGGGNDGQDLRGFTANTDNTQPSLTVSVGDDGGGETRPRNIAMMYVIKI